MWDDVHVLHPNRIAGTTDSRRLIDLAHGDGGLEGEERDDGGEEVEVGYNKRGWLEKTRGR